MAWMERLPWPFLSEIEGPGLRRKMSHKTHIQVLVLPLNLLLWRMFESMSCFVKWGQ